MRPGPSSAKNRRTRHRRATGSEPGSPSGVRFGGRSGVIADAPESTSARMSGMDRSGVSNRIQLRAIAHRVMAQRGLQPDFSPAVQAETEAIRQTATDADPAIRDLRDLLWCSIDNDDSRDLDQLTVTAPMPEGRGQGPRRGRRRRRAGQAGLRRRWPRADQHDLGLHRGRDLPDAAREALDRSHVARSGPGAPGRRRRDGGRRATGRSPPPRSTAPSSRTGRSSPTTASRPGWTGPHPRPRALPRSRGSTSRSGSRTGSRRP